MGAIGAGAAAILNVKSRARARPVGFSSKFRVPRFAFRVYHSPL
jgi:hypothetical protein